MKKVFAFLTFLAVFSALSAKDSPAVYGDIPDYGERYLSPDFVKAHGDRLFVTARTGY